MSALRDVRLRTRWKRGRAAGSSGPFLVSYTQFTPHRLGDVFGIWRASERLSRELAAIEEAHGVLTYFQPGRRRVGSLSVWTGEGGLAAFVGLPYHREIMRRYRPRGLPLRSASWWAEELRLGPALAEGQALIDAGGAQK